MRRGCGFSESCFPHLLFPTSSFSLEMQLEVAEDLTKGPNLPGIRQRTPETVGNETTY